MSNNRIEDGKHNQYCCFFIAQITDGKNHIVLLGMGRSEDVSLLILNMLCILNLRTKCIMYEFLELASRGCIRDWFCMGAIYEFMCRLIISY